VPAADGLVHGPEARTAEAGRGSALSGCRPLAQTGLAGSVAAIRYGRGGGRSPAAAPRGVRPGSPSCRSGRLPVCLNGLRAGRRKARASGGDVGDYRARNTADSASLQEGALEVKLEVGHWTNALRKETAQMLDRLEQRIGLCTDRRLLLSEKPGAHFSQLPAHPVQHMIERLQRKGQGQRFGRRFDGTPGPPSVQQSPQPGPRDRMARQHLGQENGKAPTTAAAPTPIAAPHPLPALHAALPIGRAGVVAVKLAVAVQRFSSPAFRTAELLE
jgi:hypothetical protein